MNNNKKKSIVLLIATAFLFAALFDGWPYGFFTLLRFVVFASSAYVAWMAYEVQKEKWVWIFGFLAVLFNPFIVIHLDREIWSVIDLIVGVFMIISLFVLKIEQAKDRIIARPLPEARTARQEGSGGGMPSSPSVEAPPLRPNTWRAEPSRNFPFLFRFFLGGARKRKIVRENFCEVATGAIVEAGGGVVHSSGLSAKKVRISSKQYCKTMSRADVIFWALVVSWNFFSVTCIIPV
jgi:hypothetical protein